MKNMLIAVFCLGAFASYYFALRTGVTGVGVALGGPPAVEGKARAGLTRSEPGGYLRYSWTVLPLSAKGKLPVYLDLGASGVSRGEPAVKAKKTGSGNAAVRKGGGVTVKNLPPKKPAGRAKRVSKLRDPGEAMGGEIYTELPAKTGVPPQKKK